MERKDYAERIMNVKNDILNEIRNILGYGCKHDFTQTFFVHYVEGETATTEECTAVETDNDGMVIFHVNNVALETEKIEGETVFTYDPESFLDILDNLKKEVREKKLTVLRDLIIMNGGKISFNGSFTFSGCSEGDNVADCEDTKLLGLEYQQNDGRMIILDDWQGQVYNNSAKYIPDSELDRIIEYVRNNSNASVFLTGKQMQAVETFRNAYEALKNLDVKIIRDNADDKLHFINAKYVDEIFAMTKTIDSNPLDINITEQMLKNPSVEPIISQAYYSNDNEHVFCRLIQS